MKKLIALVCMSVMAVCAFAAGNLKADECELGEVSSSKEIKPGFAYFFDKGITIEDKSADPIKNGDVTYSKRIKTKGIADGIKITAKKGEVLTIVATSSSKNEARFATLRPADKLSKKIGSIKCPEWNMSAPKFSTGSITIPEDGEYVLRGSSGGGLYFFEIDLK